MSRGNEIKNLHSLVLNQWYIISFRGEEELTQYIGDERFINEQGERVWIFRSTKIFEAK